MILISGYSPMYFMVHQNLKLASDLGFK